MVIARDLSRAFSAPSLGFHLVFTTVLLLVNPIACTQEVQQGGFAIAGTVKPLRFVNVSEETFISWGVSGDLSAALPGWFTINAQGQVTLTPGIVSLLSGTGSSGAGQVIESRIRGSFEGWNGETIFSLDNGQIWQQAEYDYRYHYAYRPEVLIVDTSRGWIMMVDGVDERLRVNGIR